MPRRRLFGTYYWKQLQLKKKGIEIKHQSVEDYLAKGGQIQVIDNDTIDVWENAGLTPSMVAHSDRAVSQSKVYYEREESLKNWLEGGVYETISARHNKGES